MKIVFAFLFLLIVQKFVSSKSLERLVTGAETQVGIDTDDEDNAGDKENSVKSTSNKQPKRGSIGV